MDSVPCPGCSAPLGLDQEVCGHCRRPRDEYEIERGHELVREFARRKARRPYIAAAWGAAAATAGALFLLRAPLLGQVAAWRADIAKQFADAEDPGKSWEHKDRSAAAANILAATSLVNILATPPAFLPPPKRVRREIRPAPAAASAATAAPVPPAAAPTPPPAPELVLTVPPSPPQPNPWGRAFYGVVYDLAAAKPVGGAALDFHLESAPDQPLGRTKTDAAGHYLIYLPRDLPDSDVPFVVVSATGYRSGQIEDPDPPYYSLPPEDRRRVIAETTEGDLDPVPLRYKSSDDAVLLNLAVLAAGPSGSAP